MSGSLPLTDADRAAALARALDALGRAVAVGAEGALAVLTPAAPEAPGVPPLLATAAGRRRVADLAGAHDFSHVAFELGATSDGNGLPGPVATPRVRSGVAGA